MPWIIAGGAILGSAVGGIMSNRGSGKANNTNIKLAREQMAWEERMSNTAMQRRADDIERAGGNRALAFTGGQSASTPSYTRANVENEMAESSKHIANMSSSAAQALATKAQIANTNANTQSQLADARVKNVQAANAEKYGDANALSESRILGSKMHQERDKQEIMNNLRFQSAAEREVAERTVNAMVQRAQQDAAKGKLDLEALENIAKIGGIEATKMKTIIQLIIQMMKD